MPPEPPLSNAAFRVADLWVQATDRADDGVLDAFFGAYDTAFVLADEKEEIDGFRDCLALNAGARYAELSARYGSFREVVLVARDAPAGRIVGGANFIVASQPAHAAPRLGYTMNLNYLFVVPGERGKNRSRPLLAACRQLASSIAHTGASAPAIGGLTFLEINDPFRLTPEQYKLDSEHAGIDQVARLAYWARIGATVLDWPYVQPALSADQRDDFTLALGVLDAGSGSLPAGLMLWHIERFFAISVLKGAPLESNASAWKQIEQLRRHADARREVDLLDLASALPGLPAQLARARDRPESLPAALREGAR